jgi:hypothetical protein
MNFKMFTVCTCIFLTSWLANANLRTSENNKTDVSFQNAAQTQHAKNVATQAALQDPDVIEAIARAKESRQQDDIEAARALFKEKREAFNQQISDLRSSGEGWGNIAKQLSVHPSFLGLGHSKSIAKQGLNFRIHPRVRSKMKPASARNFNGEDTNKHRAARSISKGKRLGSTFAKSRDHNKSRGRSIGHDKGKASGHEIGRGIGHGNGRGGGHGRGNK